MTTIRNTSILAFIVLVLGASRPSEAQGLQPDSATCADAADSLLSGRLDDDIQYRALAVSGACGNSTAITSALDRRRALPYSSELATFFRAVPLESSTHQWLVAAAGDAGTSVPVRVISLITLMRSPYASAIADYDSVINTAAGTPCLFTPVGDTLPTPSAWMSLASSALGTSDALVNNTGAPHSVRTAANCLGNAIRLKAGWGRRTVAALVPQGITLAYVCANVFRIRNSNDQSIAVRYDVLGTNESETLTIIQAKPATGYSEALFETTATGTVRLYLDGVLLHTVSNGGTTCTH